MTLSYLLCRHAAIVLAHHCFACNAVTALHCFVSLFDRRWYTTWKSTLTTANGRLLTGFWTPQCFHAISSSAWRHTRGRFLKPRQPSRTLSTILKSGAVSRQLDSTDRTGTTKSMECSFRSTPNRKWPVVTKCIFIKVNIPYSWDFFVGHISWGIDLDGPSEVGPISR